MATSGPKIMGPNGECGELRRMWREKKEEKKN